MSPYNQNINHQIACGIMALESHESTNNLLPKTSIKDVLEMFKEAQDNVILLDSELKKADITIERVRREKNITAFIAAIKKNYHLLQEPIPNWLKQKNKSPNKYYQKFFEHAQSIDSRILSGAEVFTRQNLAFYEDEYDDWKSFVANEEKDKDLAEKISQAIDLRAAIIGMLRYLSYSCDEIEAILNEELKNL